MPCQDDRSYYYEQEAEQQVKLDKLTRLLCEACQLIKNPDQTDRMSKELYDWHSEHEQKDKEREDKFKGGEI